jgi:hypothetical protein
MENKPYIVYVKVNDGYITAVNSSEFLTDTTEWVEIDSGYGDKYHHAQGNYFPMPIITEDGAYRYKLIDGKAVECTEEEIQDQEKSINILENPPTQLDKIESKVAYLAMMTGYNEILEEE